METWQLGEIEMSYFMDQKKKYMKGEKSEYDIQDDSDERVFKKGSDDYGNITDEAFKAQERLNKKWVK